MVSFLPFTVFLDQKRPAFGTCLVQWVRLCSHNAEGLDLISGWGTRSCMHAVTKKSHVAQLRPSIAKINNK